MNFTLTTSMYRVLRYVEFFFFRFFYALSQYAPIAILNHWMHFRLRGILQVAREIPFWSRRLLQSGGEEWNSDFIHFIYPISKIDLRNSKLPYVDTHAPSWRYAPYSTSGSTGILFFFYLDRREWPQKYAAALRAYGWTGRKSSDLIVKTFGSHSPFSRYWKIFPHDNPSDLAVSRYKLYKILRSARNVVLHSFPSFIIPLAGFWEKDKPGISLRSIVLSGEHLTSSTRTHLEWTFKAPVYLAYACREFGIIAQECEAKDGFHILYENMLLEIIDEKGQIIPPGGKGEIVITYYLNKIMPFIRYRIGDIGSILSEPCVCGRTLPRLRFEGRQTAILPLNDGKQLYLVEVQRSIIEIAGEAIREFQLYQNKERHLTLFIVPTDRFTPALRDRLMEKLSELSQRTVGITVEIVSTLPPRGGVKRAFFSEILSLPK